MNTPTLKQINLPLKQMNPTQMNPKLKNPTQIKQKKITTEKELENLKAKWNEAHCKFHQTHNLGPESESNSKLWNYMYRWKNSGFPKLNAKK